MGNGIRSYFFAIVLYDDDVLHQHALKYIQSCPLWLDQYFFICHDKDIVEPIRYSKSEEETDCLLPRLRREKKRHYHVLLKLKSRTHLKSFLNIFRVRGDRRAIDFALAVDNAYAYLTYMLHQDFESLHDDTKFKYSVKDLNYSLGAEVYLSRQNGNFVSYFQDIMDKLGSGQDIFDILSYTLPLLSPQDAEDYLRTVRQFQYLFVQRGEYLARKKFNYNIDGG